MDGTDKGIKTINACTFFQTIIIQSCIVVSALYLYDLYILVCTYSLVGSYWLRNSSTSALNPFVGYMCR